MMAYEIGKTTFDVVLPMFEEIFPTFEVVFAILVPKKGENRVALPLYYKDTTFFAKIQICLILHFNIFSLL